MGFTINKNVNEIDLENLPKCVKSRIDDDGIVVIIVDMECFKILKKEEQKEIEKKFDIKIEEEQEIDIEL